ncbi:uncharacterized protein [Polyergus mexicanus]|uniref:uncharacterized protein n=1 Tax=Polyergus mexicanus TaxID=615972 RepID=UPI0038B666AD
MDFIGARYYKINKILLNGLGLWPSKTTGRIKFESIIFFIIFFSFLFVQFCTLITSECNMDLVLNVLSHILPTFIYTVKYYAYYFNAEKIKLMMDRVQSDWNMLNDKKEIEIIEKYTHRMNFYTIIFTLLFCISLIVFIFIEISPIILDIIVPLNETRPHSMHVLAEYFIDSEKYFPLMILHEIIACLAGFSTILATATITMAYMQHGCGMLKIVSFRIQHVFGKNMMMLKHSSPRIERIICDRIIHAVDLHRRILKFFDFIISTFTIAYSILIIAGVASMSINLYHLLQPSTTKNMKELFSSVVIVFGHLIYMFLANYNGQKVTDHTVEIFNAICNVSWYIAPLSSQKILLFLMQRMIKSFQLVICNIFVASLEGFSTLFTKSLSYLTVIYSLQ